MADCSYNMVEHLGADIPSRFYVNGIRVSRARFDDLRDRAYNSPNAKLDCFATKCKQIGKKFRRINYSTIRFSY